MSETEWRYAQIEKEALATTWTCDKFSHFIIGKHIKIETDHKLLVPILGAKHLILDSLPPRLFRFRLRLERFDYDIRHVKGKALYTADTLSRAQIASSASADSIMLQELAEMNAIGTVSHLPANTQRLEMYRRAQSKDPVCKLLFQYCKNGWPDKRAIDSMEKPYWEIHRELTVVEGLVMRGSRKVVPQALQSRGKHSRNSTRATWGSHEAVFEPEQRCGGLVSHNKLQTSSITVQSVLEIASVARSPSFLLHSQSIPGRRSQLICSTFRGSNYIVAVDYFSRFPEILQLRSTTSQSVVNVLKSDDNGP